ncbi:Murein DD-endopeptidase MepM [Bythopirellula goksoeyrii]|uniref:Murein DD-endopeptidase MepM n=1 Tax=Bythopirellula goksoeyrii TaxID=1400387 RepID=A0A5B9QI94_9BACT|nr:Murein DD-endopeptidase MepM [Bythopirellula goksoeyrii]
MIHTIESGSSRASKCISMGICFVFLLTSSQTLRAQIKLVFPLGGTAFEDWVIGNYNDVDTRPIADSDYRGGNYTYDGHDALDIGLAHFRKMDEGVTVLAAAPGTVVTAMDGAFDRWAPSNPNPPGEIGNLVVIDHGGGIRTTYAHLKKDSVSVQVGDSVIAGQQVGLVGSSGGSTGPHLHFAVYQNGNPVETYKNPDQWWYDPLPYTGDVPGVLDSGIANHWPTQTEVEAGVHHQGIYSVEDGSGQLAVMWNYLYGISAGSEISFQFLRPNGSQYANYQWTDENGLTVGFWNIGVDLPSSPDLGVWNVNFRVNGELISNKSFLVVEPIPGDFDLDGDVDGEDFLSWQRGDSPVALSRQDFDDWQETYGTATPYSAVSTQIPEVSSSTLILIGILTSLVRRQLVTREV